MGVHDRHRRSIVVKGELIGDRLLKVGNVTYSVLPYEVIPKYKTCFFLLWKMGYVYAILNYVPFDSANRME